MTLVLRRPVRRLTRSLGCCCLTVTANVPACESRRCVTHPPALTAGPFYRNNEGGGDKTGRPLKKKSSRLSNIFKREALTLSVSAVSSCPNKLWLTVEDILKSPICLLETFLFGNGSFNDTEPSKLTQKPLIWLI